MRAHLQRTPLGVALAALLGLALVAGTGCRRGSAAAEVAPEAESGGKLSISFHPGDGGRLQSLEGALSVGFSRPVEPEEFSFEVTPDPGGWSVSWHGRGRWARLQPGNPFAPGVRYRITVRVEPDHVTTSFFSASGPSSLALIGQAESEQRIDPDTAWTYRLRALFEPDRLPPAYRSSTPIRCGTSLIRQYYRRAAELRPSTRDDLRPYLLRPTHPDSVFATRLAAAPARRQVRGLGLVTPAYAAERCRQGSWYCARSSVYPITAWSRRSAQRARAVIAAVERHQMHESFKSLLGREPLSDRGAAGGRGHPNPDGNLDIYLVPLAPAGQAIPVYPGQQKTPTYILISHGLKGKVLAATLAHELFHAFQDAFDSEEEAWWAEGTANWAEDYIDASWDLEQWDLKHAFRSSGPIHQFRRLDLEDGQHEYGAYLFPYYLSKVNPGQPKVIGQIWAACESSTALDAVDNTVGLDYSLKHFALQSTDFSLYKGVIPDARGPLQLYPLHGELELELDSPGEYEVPLSLPPLTVTYLAVYNQVHPGFTASVRFNLKDFARVDTLSVQAIVEWRADTETEDWSGRSEQEYCLSREDKRLESVHLVISSSERKSPAAPKLKIEVRQGECPPPGGTGSFQIRETREVEEMGDEGPQTYRRSEYKASGSLVFEAYDGMGVFKCKAMVRYSYSSEYKEYTRTGTKYETYVDEDGAGRVECHLNYAWGLDTYYTLNIDQLEGVRGRERMMHLEGGVPVWETREYTTRGSIRSSYFSSHYGGEPDLWDLNLSGHHRESDPPSGHRVRGAHELTANWTIGLRPPPERP